MLPRTRVRRSIPAAPAIPMHVSLFRASSMLKRIALSRSVMKGLILRRSAGVAAGGGAGAFLQNHLRHLRLRHHLHLRHRLRLRLHHRHLLHQAKCRAIATRVGEDSVKLVPGRTRVRLCQAQAARARDLAALGPRARTVCQAGVLRSPCRAIPSRRCPAGIPRTISGGWRHAQ